MDWLPHGEKNFEDIFIRFGATHERDRRTDGQTDGHRVPAIAAVMHSIAQQKCGLRYVKTAIFGTCGSNNWETVADRWVHAARGFARTELSFHLCNVFRDCHTGVPREEH